MRQVAALPPDQPDFPFHTGFQRQPDQVFLIQPLADRLRQGGDADPGLYHRSQKIPLSAAHRNLWLKPGLTERFHQHFVQREVLVIKQDRPVSQLGDIDAGAIKPVWRARRNHAHGVDE
ncbi:hypothetical protein D3C72_1251120 [compost metagenome]